jgi:hypothetical protein
MADAPDSKSGPREAVWVQGPPSVQLCGREVSVRNSQGVRARWNQIVTRIQCAVRQTLGIDAASSVWCPWNPGARYAYPRRDRVHGGPSIIKCGVLGTGAKECGARHRMLYRMASQRSEVLHDNSGDLQLSNPEILITDSIFLIQTQQKSNAQGKE